MLRHTQLWLSSIAIAALIASAGAQTYTYTVTGPFSLPGAGTSGPLSVYPIVFNVPDSGLIARVAITLGGLTHSQRSAYWERERLARMERGTPCLAAPQAGAPAKNLPL
jgi:hypothetical protein